MKSVEDGRLKLYKEGPNVILTFEVVFTTRLLHEMQCLFSFPVKNVTNFEFVACFFIVHTQDHQTILPLNIPTFLT